MDSDLRQTFGKIDFIHSWHKWLPTVLSCGQRGSALSTGFIPRLRLCWRLWGFKINFGGSLMFRTFVTISWMCKKQNVSILSSTESEIISLDAGLRMDGLLALDLWDVVIEVLHSTNNTKRPLRLDPGNWCGTGNHSSNKTKTKMPTERSNRDVDQWSNVDYVATNTHSCQGESQLYIFEDNEAVIKMIVNKRTKPRNETCPEPTELRLIDCSTESVQNQRPKSILLTPKTNPLTCWRKRGSHVMSGIIFFVCETLRICRCFLAAISTIFFLIRPESKAPCQWEGKKWLPVKVHRWQNQSHWFRRRRDPLIWWCAASPQDLRDPVNPVNVDEERGGLTGSGKPVRTNPSQDPIEYSQVRRQETLNMQTLGNREMGMTLRNRLAQGNLCGRWTQRQIFRTWRSQTRRFSNICKLSWESQQVTQHLQWKQ